MWARKRLDVGWSDLAFGIARSIVPPNRQAAAREVEGAFGPSAETLACLSVRSGFDLLLAALEFTPRSEVLLSAMNIGDMPKIIEGQGLIPIPVNLDVESFGPNLASLNRADYAPNASHGGRPSVRWAGGPGAYPCVGP